MTKHLVKWNRPEPRTIGKSNMVVHGEYIYRSKCGRFEIRKRFYQLPCSSVAYVLTEVESGRRIDQCDTLADAKYVADLELDPNFDPEG